MSKYQSFKFEKNIYVENRCDAFRFVVKVKGLSDTSTFSSVEQGVPWARRRRVELFEEAAGGVKSKKSSVSNKTSHESKASIRPECLPLTSIFDSYVEHDLPKLSGKDAEASRIRRLKTWFGQYNLGEIDNHKIEEWQSKRQLGLYGSGRNQDRGRHGHLFQTKQQRYLSKQSGHSFPVERLASPSTQTIRHELAVFRRAVKAYFKRKPELKKCKSWIFDHDLFTLELPQAATPRRRRLSDEEIIAIFNKLPSLLMKTAVSIALLTSLRRSEIVSLRWEDVDFNQCVVLLRAPGHIHKKSKVTSRDVPLLPGAMEALKKLGVKETGQIFPVAAGSLSQAWRRAADEANIYNARLHDCRREAISRLVERGELLLSHVVLFSGHSDIAVLQKHYLKPNPSVIALQLGANPNIQGFIPTL